MENNHKCPALMSNYQTSQSMSSFVRTKVLCSQNLLKAIAISVPKWPVCHDVRFHGRISVCRDRRICE